MGHDEEESVRMLLHIAGETFVESFPDKVQEQYRAKRNWNLIWVLVPLYTTTPVLAVFMCLTSFARVLSSLTSLAS